MKRINRRLYYKGKRCILFKRVCKNCGQLKIVYKKFGKKTRNGVVSIETTCNVCKHEKRRVKKVCEICGKEFTTTHSTTRFCSEKCANTRNKTGQIINCEYCGKEFYITPKDFKEVNITTVLRNVVEMLIVVKIIIVSTLILQKKIGKIEEGILQMLVIPNSEVKF